MKFEIFLDEWYGINIRIRKLYLKGIIPFPSTVKMMMNYEKKKWKRLPSVFKTYNIPVGIHASIFLLFFSDNGIYEHVVIFQYF